MKDMRTICKYHMEDRCRYGKKCKFEHDPVSALARAITGHPGWYKSATNGMDFIEIRYFGRFEAFESFEN